jgi:hypothetical protein
VTARRRRSARIAAAAAVLCSLAAAPAASAGDLTTAAGACPAQSLSQPFLPWGDLAQYFLAANGGFERGTSGWTVTKGASVVSDNESFKVNDAKDSRSLELRKGTVATSPVTCVGIDRPAVRFFSRQASTGKGAFLRVDVLFEDLLGATRSMTIGALTASGTWQPTPPLVITASLLPTLPNSQTPVAFQFLAVGSTFRLDDVYVDSYGGR